MAKWLENHAEMLIAFHNELFSFKTWMQKEIQSALDNRGVEEITIDLYKVTCKVGADKNGKLEDSSNRGITASGRPDMPV